MDQHPLARAPCSAPKPYRLILHCNPSEVTENAVREALTREIANACLRSFHIKSEPFYMEVTVASGTRYVPVSIIEVLYENGAESAS